MSKAYPLTESQITAIARLCWQEQGSIMGAAAEASLMCNLFEKQSKFKTLYEYVKDGGWFANAGFYMQYGVASAEVVDTVSDVLAGNRTLPEYVDEHDCLSDILSISTGSVTDLSAYIKDVTVIRNRYGSVYTFYCFPSAGSDPFGYTSKPMSEKKEAVTMSKIEAATKWMEDLAADPAHGYDQIYRWGEKGDYDCSSAIITAFRTAGIPLTCTYTGNMKKDMIANSFIDVTEKINLSTGAGLIRGDVLLNEAHHVAMYIGDGKEVEASINEKGTATGGTPGDQTGLEILVRSYRSNYPWDCVLRFQGKEDLVKTKSCTVKVPYVTDGDTGLAVTLLQYTLNLLTGARLDVDGEFGPATDKALKAYQTSKGITASGLCGAGTFRRIMMDLAARTYAGEKQE